MKKPEQYQIGIDTFERIEANEDINGILSFVRGNIDKYTWRKKNQDRSDFVKIIDYCSFAIKNIDEEERKLNNLKIKNRIERI